MSKTLIEILQENDVKLFESGDKWVAVCPFHKGDRDPSFTIYPGNTYFCFGCQKWGNPVKFLVEYKGITAKEALEIVGEDYELPKSEKQAIKIKNLLKTSKFLYEVAEHYHKHLISQPGPIKYLQDRGLTTDTISRYMLGYTDGAVLEFK